MDVDQWRTIRITAAAEATPPVGGRAVISDLWRIAGGDGMIECNVWLVAWPAPMRGCVFGYAYNLLSTIVRADLLCYNNYSYSTLVALLR